MLDKSYYFWLLCREQHASPRLNKPRTFAQSLVNLGNAWAECSLKVLRNVTRNA